MVKTNIKCSCKNHTPLKQMSKQNKKDSRRIIKKIFFYFSVVIVRNLGRRTFCFVGFFKEQGWEVRA